ncbi:hypothetical protein E2F48_04045 [Arthrobacter crusticola]|uniref:Regulatory protein RecX n=1 Tax=Arthrobacter crusticola TaxID=2547960 RepID=A0A4R5TYY6_9MICC|nr:hypothetical protein [Arthrobacter crusticola]TDK26381.1 hypothetical protein E2F48_04045 [Arthrobacter crusticola]
MASPQRELDQVANLGQRGWRDDDSAARVLEILAGLRQGGLIGPDAILEDMRSRGFSRADLARLRLLIRKTPAEAPTPR